MLVCRWPALIGNWELEEDNGEEVWGAKWQNYRVNRFNDAPPPLAILVLFLIPALLKYQLQARSFSRVLLGRIAASWPLFPQIPF